MGKTEWDGSFGDPNGNAITVQETRVGPPLAFVARKLYQSLVYVHVTHISIGTYVPESCARPKGWKSAKLSVKNDGLLDPIRSAFSTQLTAFLALYNMLALEKEPALVGRLLEMSSWKFRVWLDRIAKVGSISG